MEGGGENRCLENPLVFLSIYSIINGSWVLAQQVQPSRSGALALCTTANGKLYEFLFIFLHFFNTFGR